MGAKDFGRAKRRHHVARVKKSRKLYWGRQAASLPVEPMSAKHLGMVARTPKLCGWACCGNARRWAGELTFQERRLFQDLGE
jgi:hypothetical protein